MQTPDYIVSFNSVEDNVRLIEPLIENIRYKHDIDQDICANMIAAVSEAVNNAIIHGNKSNPNKTVTVTILAFSNSVEFTILDEGPGFDSSKLPDPTDPSNLENLSGRGVFIIKTLADRSEFAVDKGKAVISFQF